MNFASLPFCRRQDAQLRNVVVREGDRLVFGATTPRDVCQIVSLCVKRPAHLAVVTWGLVQWMRHALRPHAILRSQRA